jgi:hypothetical protein
MKTYYFAQIWWASLEKFWPEEEAQFGTDAGRRLHRCTVTFAAEDATADLRAHALELLHAKMPIQWERVDWARCGLSLYKLHFPTLRSVYEAKTISTQYSLCGLEWVFPELDIGYEVDKRIEIDKRIVVETKFFHCTDGRRIAKVAVVNFDHSPVAVFVCGGREGDDVQHSWVVTPTAHKALQAYVRDLMPLDDREPKLLGLDEPEPMLSLFYGNLDAMANDRAEYTGEMVDEQTLAERSSK